jgi:hypothetical protein
LARNFLHRFGAMKPRARRVTLAAAVLGVLVSAVFVSVQRDTIRNHVEGWWFLLSEDTTTLRTDPELEKLPRIFRGDGKNDVFSAAGMVHVHASHSNVPLVIARKEMMKGVLIRPFEADTYAGILKTNGWRLVELQLPHVIIAYPPAALDPMWIRLNQHQPADFLQGSYQGGVPGWDLAKPGRR